MWSKALTAGSGSARCSSAEGYLEGHVGDVAQLVVCEGEKVQEAQLGERSRLDLLQTVVVHQEPLE